MKRLLWILIALAVCAVVARSVMSLRRNAESPFAIGTALPPGKIEPQVSATWDRAYLLAPDGSLWAWGGTQFGSADVQLPGASEIPRQVGTNTDWIKFSASWAHVIAIKADGSLWGWGNNSLGELGVPGPASSTTPLRIGTDHDWLEVSVGACYSLALKTNDSLWAWGRNQEGQVGDAAQTNWFEPHEIVPGSRWRAISTGYFNSYALRDDGTLWRWGLDALTGGTKHDLTPRQLGNETNWAAISGGEYHLVARKQDGSIWLHGQNAHIVSPRDATGSVSGLVQLGSDHDWREIYSGANNVTLRKADGSWWVCGDRLEWEMEPWAFSGGGGARVLLAKDGTLWTWGERLGSKAPRQFLADLFRWVQRLLSGRGGSISAIAGNPEPLVDNAPHKVWTLPPPAHVPRPAASP
jgi:alpha-tubulin suppressor-like RCC1 family protein